MSVPIHPSLLQIISYMKGCSTSAISTPEKSVPSSCLELANASNRTLQKAHFRLCTCSKQAPGIWYQTLATFLKDLGFHPLMLDVGVFAKDHTYIAVHVDDLLIVGPSKGDACTGSHLMQWAGT
jgi:hypothetical protein